MSVFDFELIKWLVQQLIASDGFCVCFVFIEDGGEVGGGTQCLANMRSSRGLIYKKG